MGKRKGGGFGGTKGKGSKKKSKSKNGSKVVDDPFQKLSRSERRHMKEYGEAHPANDVIDDRAVRPPTRKGFPVTQSEEYPQAKASDNGTYESDDESDDSQADPYQELLRSRKASELNNRALKRQRVEDAAELAVTTHDDDGTPDSDAATDEEAGSDASNTERDAVDYEDASAMLAELGDEYEMVPVGGEGDARDAQDGADGDGSAADDVPEEDDAEEIDADEVDGVAEDVDVVLGGGNIDDGGVDTFRERYDTTPDTPSFQTLQSKIDIILRESVGRAHMGESADTVSPTLRTPSPKSWTALPPQQTQTLGVATVSVVTGAAGGVNRQQLIADGSISECKLAQPVLKSRVNVGAMEPMSKQQLEFFSHLNSYRDIVFTDRSASTAVDLQRAYVLHALNHVLKTRARIIKNAAKLKGNDDLECRDQGFARPKVLLLVPYRSMAFTIINTLISLLEPTKDDKDKNPENFVKNYERFTAEFSVSDDDDDDTGKHPNAGHRFYFDGNSDDCFRVGISLTRTTMKLFADFYHADILVASPLGLRLIIGSEGDKPGAREFDFLSSVEVLVLDQCESFLMQNWDHVDNVMTHVNRMPLNTRDTDFSRVRQWYLDGLAPYLRQTVVLSAFRSPEINRMVRGCCVNAAGRVQFEDPDTVDTITKVPIQVPQAFHRIDCSSMAGSADARFRFFVEKVIPEFATNKRSHVLVVVPSYFDFVRLRNYCRKEAVSFGQICEYTSTSNVSRARSNLFHGKRTHTLYTERYHYHFRPRLRGVHHVIFYQVPEFAEFYPELIASIAAPSTATVTTLYTKYDAMRLKRVIGASRTQRMLSAEASVHMFV